MKLNPFIKRNPDRSITIERPEINGTTRYYPKFVKQIINKYNENIIRISKERYNFDPS